METYKAVEITTGQIILVPVRHMDNADYLLWSDLQALEPTATAVVADGKLIPFAVDTQLQELSPKRVLVNETDTIWQVHSPPQPLEHKLDQLAHRLDQILGEDTQSAMESTTDEPTTNPSSHRSTSPPPAFALSAQPTSPSSSRPSSPDSSSSSIAPTNVAGPSHEHPPSYETSVYATIQTLTQHIRRFEQHIPNRHKSPRWLARRAGWLGYNPTTIEQVAYQLVQLEMALLWTAVTESWIQERETWLTLVASARTERHLAGALVNLERHTLVLDEAWQDIREAWTRDLLEVIVSVSF